MKACVFPLLVSCEHKRDESGDGEDSLGQPLVRSLDFKMKAVWLYVFASLPGLGD